MGLLVARGTIDLNQFWPSGESDGDTAHVLVKSFKYDGQITRAFEGATLHGQTVIHKDGTVVVRWQGIDSPELHYGGKWFRQHWGQAPSVHLAAFLKDKAKGANSVEVQVTTRVKKPNDVFDKYGRFVGDLLLGDVNLNHWMLENGWAFPALYNSLEDDELNAFIAAGKKGKSKLLNDYTRDLSIWDPSLQTPHKQPPGFKYDEAQDRGSVQFPKTFRRIVTFRTDAKASEKTLKAYLRGTEDSGPRLPHGRVSGAGSRNAGAQPGGLHRCRPALHRRTERTRLQGGPVHPLRR